MKSITVVICTYNRAELLTLALESLKNQTISKDLFNVIVIDNNSTDHTRKISDSFTNNLDIQYFLETKQGLSHARNRGYQEAITEYVAYLDDDAKAKSDWIEKMLLVIKTKKPRVFGGPYYPFYLTARPKWFKDEYQSKVLGNSPKWLNGNEYLSGSNMVFEKKLLKEFNGFEPSLGMSGEKIFYGEEIDLQNKIREGNISIYANPNLIVYHLVPNHKMTVKWSLKSFLNRKKSMNTIKNSKRNIWISVIYKTIFLAKTIDLILKYPIRDKKKYPYWQNYVIENSKKIFFYL